jgi:L-aspartate oxidase
LNAGSGLLSVPMVERRALLYFSLYISASGRGEVTMEQFDVIIVGAGAAGLYSALCLPAHLRVAVITKNTLSLSASDWAQGGIAAVVAPDDSTELHIQDTLRAGSELCDYGAVKFLIENAAHCIQNLVSMGVAFDRHQGELAMTLEAAHSRRRVLHAADTTGRAVVTTLLEQVLARDNIQVIAPAVVLDLWIEADRCQGICIAIGAEITWYQAGAVILATGGGGQVFAQTTNPVISTGDGVAIAHRAGAVLRDLEFVQFHPTALTQPGAPRFLISEAVRGEGAHLVDDHGHRFAFDYDPAGELAPRDVVSRAIFSHLQKTATDPATANVWLDLRPIAPAKIQHRFPNIIQVCQTWGIDVFTQPIPVAPAAHYWMGGIETDIANRTAIAGLYTVGEAASTGVHGANRLASNSLLECLVFGAQFQSIALQPFTDRPAPTTTQTLTFDSADSAWVSESREALRKIVWQSAGIVRQQASLNAAITQVEQWQQAFHDRPSSRQLMQLRPGDRYKLDGSATFQQIRDWSEFYNLSTVAALLLKSAAFRTESRGGHYRSDFPHSLEDWRCHTMIRGQQWTRAAVDAGPG